MGARGLTGGIEKNDGIGQQYFNIVFQLGEGGSFD